MNSILALIKLTYISVHTNLHVLEVYFLDTNINLYFIDYKKKMSTHTLLLKMNCILAKQLIDCRRLSRISLLKLNMIHVTKMKLRTENIGLYNM